MEVKPFFSEELCSLFPQMFRSLKGETFHLKKLTPSTDTEAIAEEMSTAQILRRATQAKTKSKTKIFLSHVNKPL